MADKKIDALTDLGANLAGGDLFYVGRTSGPIDYKLDYDDFIISLNSDIFTGGGADSIAIRGTTTHADSIVIGPSATTVGTGGGGLANEGMIAIGDTAKAQQHGSIAIGRNTIAGDTVNSSEDSISIGTDSVAENRHSISIGHNCNSNGVNCISIGDECNAGVGTKCVAIGNTAKSGSVNLSGANNIAIGNNAEASATNPVDNAVAIGNNAAAEHDDSVALGSGAVTTQDDQVTFGDKLLRLGSFAVAGLPTASNYTGHIVYVTNGDAGSPCLAVSNGTSWLRVALGSAVSAS